MSMEVAEKEYVSTFQRPLHHELRVIVYGVELAGGADPLPVQVLPHQRASVVANNDTVRVQHRDYFEDKGVSEEHGLLFV